MKNQWIMLAIPAKRLCNYLYVLSNMMGSLNYKEVL